MHCSTYLLISLVITRVVVLDLALLDSDHLAALLYLSSGHVLVHVLTLLLRDGPTSLLENNITMLMVLVMIMIMVVVVRMITRVVG